MAEIAYEMGATDGEFITFVKEVDTSLKPGASDQEKLVDAIHNNVASIVNVELNIALKQQRMMGALYEGMVSSFKDVLRRAVVTAVKRDLVKQKQRLRRLAGRKA